MPVFAVQRVLFCQLSIYSTFEMASHFNQTLLLDLVIEKLLN